MYVQINNNNQFEYSNLPPEGTQKAEKILNKLKEISESEDSTKKVEAINAADVVYKGFNKKLGLLGRAFNRIKSWFSDSSKYAYIKKVDALYNEISAKRPIPILAYVVGAESQNTLDAVKSLCSNQNFKLEPINIIHNSDGQQLLKKTEREWKGNATRILVMDAAILSRADQFTMYAEALKKDRVALILVGSEEKDLIQKATSMQEQWKLDMCVGLLKNPQELQATFLSDLKLSFLEKK